VGTREDITVAKLGGFFGPHDGRLKIYWGDLDIGSGAFGAFSDFAAKFAGSYDALGQSGTFTISIALTDQNPASAFGPCTITLNDKTDGAATYQASGQKLTVTTTLNDAPLEIYPNQNGTQSGTQIDNISDYNIWVGP
jgi:hypothetical protein